MLKLIRWKQSKTKLDRSIPDSLVAYINNATVNFRSPDLDGNQRIAVKVLSLGTFYWEGTDPACMLIAKVYPAMSTQSTKRAAQLLAQVIRNRNLDSGKRSRRDRRAGCVVSPRDSNWSDF